MNNPMPLRATVDILSNLSQGGYNAIPNGREAVFARLGAKVGGERNDQMYVFNFRQRDCRHSDPRWPSQTPPLVAGSNSSTLPRRDAGSLIG